MDIEFYEQKSIANKLSRAIEAYWRKSGFNGIATQVVMAPGNIFNIQSNIGPTGYPPRT
jgi:hypothetical protein